MSTSPTPLGLDAEELAHLGVALAAQGRMEQALLYLKAAVQQEPDSAQANYLLGAHYAQLGMQQRAADFMRRAAAINPELLMASFQAGWLFMGMNKGGEASACWEPLLGLPQEHPLHLFARGLQALMQDDFANCRDYLTQGIQGNNSVPALNEDMKKILAELEQRGLTTANADALPSHLGAALGGYGPQ